MKKQLCTIGIGALLAMGLAIGAPVAQDNSGQAAPEGTHGGRPRMDPSRQVKMLTKRLNLSDDQQKQVLSILTDRQQQFENIRNDSSLSQQDRRAKMQSLREESDTKIKAVLNDDQKQKYDQMQQQMRERMQQRREQGDNPPAGSNN